MQKLFAAGIAKHFHQFRVNFFQVSLGGSQDNTNGRMLKNRAELVLTRRECLEGVFLLCYINGETDQAGNF